MGQITAIAADTETLLNESPFLPQNPTHWNCVAGGHVYGVLLPGRNARNGNYQRWNGTGAKTVWTETELVNLANAHQDGGAITDATRLAVVVLEDGVPLHRVQSDAVPAAGQFKVWDDAGTAKITFGDTHAATVKLEMFLTDTDDISDLTLVANTPKEGTAPQVVYATEASTAIRLVR